MFKITNFCIYVIIKLKCKNSPYICIKLTAAYELIKQ